MITEKDLQEAIAECKGQRNPTSSTCIKLAAFYILRDHLFPKEEPAALPAYSYAAPVETIERIIDYPGDTEFSRVIDGKKPEDVWPVMDELMSTISVLNPPLYAGVMRKLGN